MWDALQPLYTSYGGTASLKQVANSLGMSMRQIGRDAKEMVDHVRVRPRLSRLVARACGCASRRSCCRRRRQPSPKWRGRRLRWRDRDGARVSRRRAAGAERGASSRARRIDIRHRGDRGGRAGRRTRYSPIVRRLFAYLPRCSSSPHRRTRAVSGFPSRRAAHRHGRGDRPPRRSVGAVSQPRGPRARRRLAPSTSRLGGSPCSSSSFQLAPWDDGDRASSSASSREPTAITPRSRRRARSA